MERNAMGALLAWKMRKNRKPLVLRGARQVGKTWLMREFGRRHYENVVYCNFDEEEDLKGRSLHERAAVPRGADGISFVVTSIDAACHRTIFPLE